MTQQGQSDQTYQIGAKDTMNAYRLAVDLFWTIGIGTIVKAQLKDAAGKHMMFYEPRRGWFFGDERDTPLP